MPTKDITRQIYRRLYRADSEETGTSRTKVSHEGRTKSIHSIYQKMKKQKCPFEGVYDLFAIRIIIDSPIEKEKQECWQVYSIVTDMYMPNPKRLRDWLSVPKVTDTNPCIPLLWDLKGNGRSTDTDRTHGRYCRKRTCRPLALQRSERRNRIGRMAWQTIREHWKTQTVTWTWWTNSSWNSMKMKYLSLLRKVTYINSQRSYRARLCLYHP